MEVGLCLALRRSRQLFSGTEVSNQAMRRPSKIRLRVVFATGDGKRQELCEESCMSPIPTGCEPVSRTSPFTELLGPIFQKADSSGLIIGLLAEDKHCNARGPIHEGVFGTLADIAMGYSAVFSVIAS